jgi:hypothetical protein
MTKADVVNTVRKKKAACKACRTASWHPPITSNGTSLLGMPISHYREIIMKKLFALMARTAFCLGGGVATAAGVPTYELMGFLITPHQFSAVGSAYVQERSPTSTLTLAGMPASPHQIAVLTPRSSTAPHWSE